jgi:hypothetical protein
LQAMPRGLVVMCTHVQSIKSSRKWIFFALTLPRGNMQRELSNQWLN